MSHCLLADHHRRTESSRILFCLNKNPENHCIPRLKNITSYLNKLWFSRFTCAMCSGSGSVVMKKSRGGRILSVDFCLVLFRFRKVLIFGESAKKLDENGAISAFSYLSKNTVAMSPLPSFLVITHRHSGYLEFPRFERLTKRSVRIHIWLFSDEFWTQSFQCNMSHTYYWKFYTDQWSWVSFLSPPP